ncbi:hypothetical protein Pcinc_008264 [Petrolisthes cinctipes]|uniref:Uncharacterized protein n=1 Tax=Petrolisthes cinctipes TaxID=88211 RepID=A0AAE1KXC9_PETCI|nr:hypothetical protein Pcinc_008264 [Petrolisthes cinctipes]
MSKLCNSTTPLSKPRFAPGPLSKLLNSTTPLAISHVPPGPLSCSTPLRHLRRRQRYATTPQLYAIHDAYNKVFLHKHCTLFLPCAFFLCVTSPVFFPLHLA